MKVDEKLYGSKLKKWINVDEKIYECWWKIDECRWKKWMKVHEKFKDSGW